MKEKDLFFYMIYNNEEKYNEILELLKNIEDIKNENITDEHLIFLRDFYMRLLFRIEVLSFKKYSNEEIAKILNIDKSMQLFNKDKIRKLKEKYRLVLHRYHKILKQVYKT